MTDFRLTLSIYCEHLDGECFDFGNCFKCPYQPSEVIIKSECHRIISDVDIAIAALQGIKNAEPYLHQNYLKEKLEIVKRCVSFMENYVKGDKKDG